MSLFPERVYGRANTVAGGRGYQVTNDGQWRPQVNTLHAEEQYTNAEAPLDGAVETVTKYWQGTYQRALLTHGEELWWRHALGSYNASPTAVGPLFEKSYFTDKDGPRGSYTIVHDRYARGSRPSMYQSVYRGCQVRAWQMRVMSGGNNYVTVSAEWFAQRKPPTTGGAAVNPAPYAAATVGDPGAFKWSDCEVRVGQAGRRAAHAIGFCRMIGVQVDNRLDLNRYYVDGDSNAAEPKPADTNRGFFQLNFDYAAAVDTFLLDPFERSNNISVELNGARGPYRFRLWVPIVHITNAVISGAVDDVANVAVTADIRHRPALGHAVNLTVTTEGSTN